MAWDSEVQVMKTCQFHRGGCGQGDGPYGSQVHWHHHLCFWFPGSGNGHCYCGPLPYAGSSQSGAFWYSPSAETLQISSTQTGKTTLLNKPHEIPQEHGIQENILDSNPVCFGPYHSIQWSPIHLENQVRHWCGWLVFPPVVPQCWLELWSLNCLMTLTGSFQERSEQYQQP